MKMIVQSSVHFKSLKPSVETLKIEGKEPLTFCRSFAVSWCGNCITREGFVLIQHLETGVMVHRLLCYLMACAGAGLLILVQPSFLITGICFCCRHGTRCAGEVAAEANNGICSAGVAFEAGIGGIGCSVLATSVNRVILALCYRHSGCAVRPTAQTVYSDVF